MSTPRPAATIIDLTRQQRDRAIARADFLACERDLYRTHAMPLTLPPETPT
jgi:hypothetical protein